MEIFKKPLHELELTHDNFREKLGKYSVPAIERYIKRQEKFWNKIITRPYTYFFLTYLAEEKGEYTTGIKKMDRIGSNLTKGNLIVNGSAGQHAGLLMKDGNVLIKEDAGDETGYEAEGGSILIGGNAGNDTGLLMFGGKIVCLGKVESVNEFIRGEMIYANEFGKVPEKVKKFTSDLQHAFRNEYYRLPEEFRKMFNEVIRKEPEKYFPYANNDEKRELLSSLSGIDEMDIEFEYEKGQVW